MNDFFNYRELEKTGANYLIAFGERGPGKTTDFIVEVALKNFENDSSQFMLVRAQEEECRAYNMTQMFTDHYIMLKLNEMGHRLYDTFETFNVIAERGQFVLCGQDVDGAVHKLNVIGYYQPLTTAHKIKSVAFPLVTTIFYDEFMSNSRAPIKNEFSRFTNLISTVKRKRTNFRVYMASNSVDRNCQILYDMGINPKEIKQGEIKAYSFESVNENGEKIINKVAVEFTRHYHQDVESEAFFVFGNPREMMIRNGEWETDDYLTFNDSQFYADTIRLALTFDSEITRLYAYLGNEYLYVSDTRKECDVDYFNITIGATEFKRRTVNAMSYHPFAQNIKTLVERLYCDGKILYTDNLTGDDFKNICRKFKYNV